MIPQIGDPVIIRYRHELEEQNAAYQGYVLTAAGTLGVEIADGKAAALVVETDGGATFIQPRDVVSVELDQAELDVVLRDGKPALRGNWSRGGLL